MEEKRNISNRNFDPTRAGRNLSWGAVFAGAISFVAVFLVLSFITSALGFGFLSFTDPQPLSGVGLSTGIWTLISLVVSFFVGGFVAGLSARRTGLLHGFLAWALAVIMLISFVGWIISTAVGVAANIASTTASLAVDAAGATVSTAGDALTSAVDEATDSISQNFQEIDTDQLQEDIADILGDTDIYELQPEYISSMVDQSVQDVQDAGREILLNPANADQIIDQLTTTLSNRAEEIADAVDRDAIANAVEENTDLSESEAEEAVDNIYNGLSQAADEAQNQIEDAQVAIEQARIEISQNVQQGVQSARESGDQASNTMSAGSVIIFIGLLLGLVISSYGGMLGASKVRNTIIER